MSEFLRGDIVLCADSGGNFTGKPRPVVIVQNTLYIEGMESLTVCPLTTFVASPSLRVRLNADEATGLKEKSDVEIDKVTTIRKSRITKKIGEVPEKALLKINNALRIWLDL